MKENLKGRFFSWQSAHFSNIYKLQDHISGDLKAQMWSEACYCTESKAIQAQQSPMRGPLIGATVFQDPKQTPEWTGGLLGGVCLQNMM